MLSTAAGATVIISQAYIEHGYTITFVLLSSAKCQRTVTPARSSHSLATTAVCRPMNCHYHSTRSASDKWSDTNTQTHNELSRSSC